MTLSPSIFTLVDLPSHTNTLNKNYLIQSPFFMDIWTSRSLFNLYLCIDSHWISVPSPTPMSPSRKSPLFLSFLVWTLYDCRNSSHPFPPPSFLLSLFFFLVALFYRGRDLPLRIFGPFFSQCSFLYTALVTTTLRFLLLLTFNWQTTILDLHQPLELFSTSL